MAIVGNPNSYITRKELNQALSGYIERSYVLDYIHSELETSFDNLNIYNKKEIDDTLKLYMTKAEIEDILKSNSVYYSKEETRIFVNSSFNAFKNVELPAKLAEFVTKRDLASTFTDSYYTKTEIDKQFQNVISIDTLSNIVGPYVSGVLSEYAKLSEVKSLIFSTASNPVKKLETQVNSILVNYVSKGTLNEQILRMNESINLLENTVAEYYSKSEVNDRITYLLKQYCYTREETRQLVQASFDYFKSNYLENRLDDFLTKAAYADHIENYYDKDAVDEKLASDGFCNIMYLTDSEYDSLSRRKRIKDNYLYIVYKFDRPMFIYVGSLLLAKRATTGSVGFPYTFPLSF